MTLRLKTGLEPCHLVVESRSGSRVAVWQIKASDKQAVDRCLDVSAVGIVGIAGKPATCHDRQRVPAEDGNAVPALLTMPDGAVARTFELPARKLVVGRLQFLEANDVGSVFLQPSEQNREASVDSVDVVCGTS